ncbi:heavy-metal-associated domain-containing protein [Verrucomicrobium sp. BvORR034]|uniref:heavy-metal-associated domain-containing protein n=1 Tax=Verrucomicrobium sp. BvORR034 TaxID=1396418 RepID=UPI0009DF2722|nr:heavy-metal-associated domain-containing protein [Verrucomicrobium sp. BvORR034]
MKLNKKTDMNPNPTTHPSRRFAMFCVSLAFLLVSVTGLPAEDKVVYTYEGRISGVFCSACSAKVKAAMGKLAGVSTVKISPAEELGVQALKVQSTSPDLTKEAAIAALGEAAKEFTIHQFERKP